MKKSLKIALVGYGKMGKVIEEIAKLREHKIEQIYDIDNIKDLNSNNLSLVDIVIEFTSPKSAFSNIKTSLEARKPVVSGTTGWLDNYKVACDLCKANDGAFIWASNFSIGVNIFFEINRHLAREMNRFENYDVNVHEIHHIHKLDAPSGTALILANDLLSQIDRKKNITQKNESDPQNLLVSSDRLGEVIGTHRITYESEFDFIRLEHEAKNRNGLALGAILAAEFIYNKKGVYGMNDVLGFNNK